MNLTSRVFYLLRQLSVVYVHVPCVSSHLLCSMIYFNVWCPFELRAFQEHRTCLICNYLLSHRIMSPLPSPYLSRCVFCTIKNLLLGREKLRVKTISPHSISKKEVTSGKLYLILQTGNLGMWRWNHPALCQDSFFGFLIPSFVFYLPKVVFVYEVQLMVA